MIKIVDVTGWQELIDGNFIQASFHMFNAAWGGWFIAIIYFIFQLMLYIKTRNSLLGFIMGVLFFSIYISSNIFNTGTFGFIHEKSIQVIAITLIIQLSASLYVLIWK